MATSLFRLLSRSCGLVLACAAIQSASAFSVFGPAEAWQTPTLDYVDRYFYPAPGIYDFEPGAPKNFGQGSRLNSPIVTYGYDITFLTYFGAKGVAAIDSAMAQLNSLPAASAANLSSFIMQGNQQINYTAQALQLTDLKSLVLSLMVEHMGLIGETHVWDLLGRIPITGTAVACQFTYPVINRNFDAKTYQPSSYVNGINYTYQILDGCAVAQSVADAIEFPVDGASAAELTYSSVATRYALEPGGYYLGLTYDDMGGLKYLYNKNNFAYEALDPTAAVSSFTTSPWEGVSITNATGVVGGVGVGVTTVSNFVGFLGGVEKITYVKLPTDSLIGGGFTPRTFSYTIPWLTNGSIQALNITRTVTAPDIVFSAGNLTSNNLTAPFNYAAYSRGFNFIASGAAVVAGGVVPEVISPQETIEFNNITPIYYNETPSFLDGETTIGYPILLWGSYNGTTNAPTVYPSASSLSQLIAELFNGSTTGSQSTTWYGLTGPTNAATTGTGTGQ